MEVWGRWVMIGGYLVVICGDWWWVETSPKVGGVKNGFVGCGKVR
jgi:hypothetical protein